MLVVTMKNIDFFTALLQVPGVYHVPVDSPNIDRLLTDYTWCLNCEASGLIVISVFKFSRHLYDVSFLCNNRFVVVKDIVYSSTGLAALMQYRPDELRQTVPFLVGKFKTYDKFLRSFYSAINILDLEFFDHFIRF